MSAFKIETADVALGVPTLFAYKARFTKARLALKTGAAVASISVSDDLRELALVAVPTHETLKAEINHGRWIGRCACDAGIALHYQWQWAGCFDCGNTYSQIAFPDTRTLAAVIQILGLRPAGKGGRRHRYRSWLPSETVSDLQRENRLHGWPVNATESA